MPGRPSADVSTVLRTLAEVVAAPAGDRLRALAGGATRPAERSVLLALAAIAEDPATLSDAETVALARAIARAITDYLAERDLIRRAARATRHTMMTN